ncbi:MAG: cytochrome c [Burkholderiales bacterium]
MSRGPRRWRRGAALIVMAAGVLVALAWALPWALNPRGDSNLAPAATAPPATTEQIERGAYLARAGNCMNCHTARGGAPYAGGRGIDTPFGTIFSTNLTPDAKTGLGGWSPADFWRALHHGRSKDGRLLYPAFPYPDFTLVTREDSDALFAWLKSLPPTALGATPHRLRWPYNTQTALAVWRALYFEPGEFAPDRERSAEWNRGAYLVRGLGHCAACHTPRDALGGPRKPLHLAGTPIPEQNWVAPSLALPQAAGVTNDGNARAFVQLMKTGMAPGAVALGPMAEVVQHSTQHLSEADLGAMATYLQSLEQPADPEPSPVTSATGTRRAAAGAKIYDDYCVKCHGKQGLGVPDAYPPLAGNRAVTMHDPTNLVQVVLKGGFPPATAGNPRPFGMPPYVLTLTNDEVAAVLTYIRGAWGNAAAQVTPLDVDRIRSAAAGG